jgi:hypothetical protein
MKQQYFPGRTGSPIKDEFGNDRYFVEGGIVFLGHKLHVFDANNAEGCHH